MMAARIALRSAGRRRFTRRGWTLVELLVVLAVAGVLAGVAMPALFDHVRQSRRADAVSALTRLEIAQANFRTHHATYGADLAALGRSNGLSPDGHYRLALENVSADGYTASAEALPDGVQAGDQACLRITLRVQGDQPERGPSRRCWLR